MKHFCKETSRLFSDGYERELTLLERLRVRLHLWMCDPCSNYASNLRMLDHMLSHIRKQADAHAPCLSDSDRQRILKAVQHSDQTG